jgi:tetratricopeptide (TPR) repeat protein
MMRVAGILALLALLAPDLVATCGGGGGGGRGGAAPPKPPVPPGGGQMPPGGGVPPGQAPKNTPPPQVYNTTWLPSIGEGEKAIADKEKALILYFEPKSKFEHPDFKSKMMADWSKEHSFVKIAWEKDDPKRKEYKVTPAKDNTNILIVCDKHGNPLKTFDAALSQSFPYTQIDDTLKNLAKLTAKIKADLEAGLKKAQKAFDDGKYPDAARFIAPLQEYKGYEAIEKINALTLKIIDAGNKAIDEAVKIENKKDKEKKLRQIKTEYRGFEEIENRCDEEIKKLTGMAPPQEHRPSHAELVWNEFFGAIDYSKRAPLVSERANRAMSDGLQAELDEKFEKALDCYAIAAGLDPKDSLPLVYLGEVYRHHLGRWEDAKATFKRVLELNNDDFCTAVALHGLGKMTIWEGDNEGGLKLFDQSIQRHPTALCYRNLAVFWNTEKEFKKAFDYATKAYELDPHDGYNQVFYAIYLLLAGKKKEADDLINKADFDVSMSYNFACYYAAQGKRDLVMKYLHKHFYEYERFDDVRGKEMAEARMDIHFEKYKNDPEFLKLTSQAAK